MLLWVIIKTTDNGAKCLLTDLAIILRNQDRWEHYKLQINLFNNEGPYSVLTQSVTSIVSGSNTTHTACTKLKTLLKNKTPKKEKERWNDVCRSKQT